MTERADSIRSDGVRKSWIGALLVAAPFAYYFVSQSFLGYWSLKLFAGLVVVGVVGLAKLTSGIGMVVRPRTVSGDLSNAAH